MPSTYSNLKIQLMATGENNTTWGDVTNTNLGTAIEEAIVGSADVAFSNANVTLTLTDTNATQSARNMRLNLTGTATAGYNLVVPAIEKPYIINNGTDGTITVKNSTGTGIAVPTGKTMWVYNDGTNVVDAVTRLSSLTLGTALPVASGGTGQTSYTDGQLLIGNSSGNTLTKATLTQGSNITITNGNGSITIAASSTMVYPGAGIPNSTGSAWGTSYSTTGSGTVVALATGPTFANVAMNNTNISAIKTATFNSQTTIATTTGAITVDWTSAQNQKQTEPTGTITYTFTAPAGPCHLQLLIDSDGTSTAQTINWPGTVIWLNATWSGVNNKKAVINFWYDGTSYFAIGSNQV